jgi:hypothetical protein
MKKQILFLFVVLTTSISCEKFKESDPNVFLDTGTGLKFKFDDIQMYDSSTHILYFKKSYSEFNDMLQGPFAFLDNGDTIYSGTFLPGYSSFIPSGPIILSPPHMYGDYALRIEIWTGNKPDMRNCERIIEIMKAHNILNSGLCGEINSLEINDGKLNFNYTITNKDQSDLLILDINKTGTNLFHYFTNGLYVRDLNNNTAFENNFPIQKPDPWDSFKVDWLTQLKSGESKTFSINYNLETALSPGQYNLLFEFPGLAYQVKKDQLFQNNNLIWLGDITVRKKVIIN